MKTYPKWAKVLAWAFLVSVIGSLFGAFVVYLWWCLGVGGLLFGFGAVVLWLLVSLAINVVLSPTKE